MKWGEVPHLDLAATPQRTPEAGILCGVALAAAHAIRGIAVQSSLCMQSQLS